MLALGMLISPEGRMDMVIMMPFNISVTTTPLLRTMWSLQLMVLNMSSDNDQWCQ
ncbi:hypothetical protein O9992_16645 [Vibrio lentus]|nr:hypothetical protein [Vibrio lentus]